MIGIPYSADILTSIVCTDSIRKNIQNIHVEADAEGNSLAVATDGRMMVVHRWESTPDQNPYAVDIPHPAWQQMMAIAVANEAHLHVQNCTVDGIRCLELSVATKAGNLMLTSPGAIEPFPESWREVGRFENVLASPADYRSVRVNGELLKTLIGGLKGSSIAEFGLIDLYLPVRDSGPYPNTPEPVQFRTWKNGTTTQAVLQTVRKD